MRRLLATDPTAELSTANKGHYGQLTTALLLLAHSERDSDPLSREQSLRFLGSSLLNFLGTAREGLSLNLDLYL